MSENKITFTVENLHKVGEYPEINLGDFIKYVDEIADDGKIVKAEVMQIYVNKFKDDIVLLVDTFSRGFERTQYIPISWVRAVYRDIWDMED